MKKLIIKKENLEVQHCTFENDEAMNDFIKLLADQAPWGLPERPELNEMGEPTGVTLPAEYTIEIEDITAQVEQQKINAEALAYLAETDWLMIRELEIGKAMPEEIKIKRQEARDKVKK